MVYDFPVDWTFWVSVRSPGWEWLIWCRLADLSFKVCCFLLSSCLFQAFPGDGICQLFHSANKKISPAYHSGKSQIRIFHHWLMYSLVSRRISGGLAKIIIILICFQAAETHCNQHRDDVYEYMPPGMLTLRQFHE